MKGKHYTFFIASSASGGMRRLKVPFYLVDLLIFRPLYTWPGLIIVLTGIPVYFLWKRKSRGKLAGQTRLSAASLA